ncbi:MAG: outer membrane beta-barrel protein [Bdellovibrionales bacterium]|nr:outer membrane beta-barrel protein [Bdellovibrionales bacterium]
MKLALSTLVLFFGVSSSASVGQVAIKGGSWSFQTENVRSNSESSSGFGAYSVEIAYAVSPKFQGVFGINVLMSDIYTGSSGYGFDFGGKYFPFTSAGTIDIESGKASIIIQEKWRPYIGLSFRQRIFNLALSSSYLGPGMSLGVDYSLSRDVFLNAEFRYDYLYGNGDALAKQMNMLIGLGIEF